MTSSLAALSQAIGWLYTVAWSVSFYPQIWLNYKRKSVTGLSLEYQAYNITGFTFYTVYSLTNYLVQHDKSLGLTQSVEVNDLVFVWHAVAATCVVIYQCWAYKLKAHTLNPIHLGIVVLMWCIFLYNGALAGAGILPFVNRTKDYKYSVIEYLGYCKVAISFIKYCPQAYMNWSRQSTVGWSVGNVLLDLTGGLLAFGQQGIEAYRKGDTSEFTSNIAKLLLSCESIGFDLLFLVQHYVLYRGNNTAANSAHMTKEEQERLEEETQAKARAAAMAFVPSGLLATSEEDTYLPSDAGANGSGSISPARSVNGSDPEALLEHSLDMNSIDHRARLLDQRHHNGNGSANGF